MTGVSPYSFEYVSELFFPNYFDSHDIDETFLKETCEDTKRCNQKPQIAERQTLQWQKEQGQGINNDHSLFIQNKTTKSHSIA